MHDQSICAVGSSAAGRERATVAVTGCPTGPVRRVRRLLVGMAVAVVLIFAAMVVPLWLVHSAHSAPAGTQGRASSNADAQDLGGAPTYRLTDQHGHTVSSHRFAGKVQVVSFLFPYCTTYCPVIARDLVVLRQQLRDDGLGQRVQLVSFNVDPQGAGPGQLRAFWSEFGGDADDPGFEFLTGTSAEIHAVVVDGFHVDFQKVPSGEGGDSSGASPTPTVANPLAQRARVNYDVQHNDLLEIVDGHGRIRYLFDNGSQAQTAQLLRAVRAVLG